MKSRFEPHSSLLALAVVLGSLTVHGVAQQHVERFFLSMPPPPPGKPLTTEIISKPLTTTVTEVAAGEPVADEADRAESGGTAPAKHASDGQKPGRQRTQAPGDLPEYYAAIIDQNLFRKLGWHVEPERNPFTLVGVMVAPKGSRALLVSNGSAKYVAVGEDAGAGYTVASIERGTVEVEGGAQGKLTLVLDKDVIGVSGGKSGGPAKERALPKKKEKKRDLRWRPRKGASGEEQFAAILDREGYTWDDIKRNPELGGELKQTYSYVWEDDK